MLTFNEYIDIKEATSGTCVMTFGRCNPPTAGHLKLFNKVAKLAKEYDGTAYIFLSHSQDNEKNPLSYADKIKLVRKIVPAGVKVVKSMARRMSDAVKEVDMLGFKDVVFVVGADRLKDLAWLEKDFKKYYRFNTVKVVSAGERDPESEDFTSTVSASMARKAVRDNNYELFRRCSPFDEKTTKELYDKLRNILK